MPNITLSISEELKKEMKRHSSIKWSDAVRSIIEQKISELNEAEKIAKKSKFNWEDWKLIDRELSKNAARHARALLDESNS